MCNTCSPEIINALKHDLSDEIAALYDEIHDDPRISSEYGPQQQELRDDYNDFLASTFRRADIVDPASVAERQESYTERIAEIRKGTANMREMFRRPRRIPKEISTEEEPEELGDGDKIDLQKKISLKKGIPPAELPEWTKATFENLTQTIAEEIQKTSEEGEGVSEETEEGDS